MKKMYIILIIIMQLMIIGCSGDNKPKNNEYGIFPEDPGSRDPNCCGVTYHEYISGKSPIGGRYYWMALLHSDTVINYGEGVYIPEGYYDSVNLQVSVSYLDQIPAGIYEKHIYASEMDDDVGNIKSRTTEEHLGVVNTVSYTDSMCYICCTNASNGGLDRYIACANKDIGDAVGAGAWIETRYGDLCGDISIETHSFAWVGLRDNLPGERVTSTNYLQVGYGIKRFNQYYTDTFIYMECNGLTNNRWKLWVLADIKPNDFMSSYFCKVDTSNGYLVFEYESDIVVDTILPYWIKRTIKWASWEGEIGSRETDMPGTPSDHCDFLDCFYIKAGSPDSILANFNTSDIIGVTPQQGNRSNEWGISYILNSSWLEIWDENPLYP